MVASEEAESRTMLFADVVAAPSTSLDRTVQFAVEPVHEEMRTLIEAAGGEWIKSIDTRAMASFRHAPEALGAVCEIMRRYHDAEDSGLEIRVGMATGPVVLRDGDCFGDTVNVAARIADHGKPGLVLTTLDTMTCLDEESRRLCRVYDEASLKGITGKTGIVQVVWDRRTTGMHSMPAEMMEMAAGMYLRTGGRTEVIEPRVRSFVIGRETDCDLVMDTRRASRKHARVYVQRGKFMLQDQSTNGTYVHPEGVPAEQTIYLRNESFTLIGSGVISLGAKPGFDAKAEIEYEVY